MEAYFCKAGSPTCGAGSNGNEQEGFNEGHRDAEEDLGIRVIRVMGDAGFVEGALAWRPTVYFSAPPR